jgi:two-component system, OmpR family, response regulator ResD
MMYSARKASDRAAPSVLVVDDEPTIADVLARYLERAGYRTRQAHAGPEAVSTALSFKPDLIVLDVMLPGFDGLEVMRRVREARSPELAGGAPPAGGEPAGGGPAVILLTARGEEPERIGGLRRGADDYVVKPFSPAEVVARVDAVLRRSAPREPAATEQQTIAHGGLAIDLVGRTVTLEGRPVELTALEFDLLVHLASHPGRVFTRDQLLEAVWKVSAYSSTSTVTVHVQRLRAKVEQNPAQPRYIETARGFGYRFRAERRRPGQPPASPAPGPASGDGLP